MNEPDDFLTPTLARQLEAEQALINGDPGPRLAMTSTQDPVTVFGAKVPLRSDSLWCGPMDKHPVRQRRPLP